MVDVGNFTLPGNRYSGLNQDTTVVQELYAPWDVAGHQQTYIAAILDGHGLLGEKASQLAGKALVRDLYCSTLRERQLSSFKEAELQQLMQLAFKKGHAAILHMYDDPPNVVTVPKPNSHRSAIGHDVLTYTRQPTTAAGLTSYRCKGQGVEKLLECGTTCTTAVIQPTGVCLANVGDSLAVLGSDDGERYISRALTVKHHGLNVEEAKRIAALKSPAAHILQEDGYLRITAGAWAGYELSVTRALGHKFLEEFGITPDPYVTYFDIQEQDCCMIIASDGIWDTMTGEEAVTRVMDLAAEGKTALQAAQELVEASVDLAAGHPGGDVDNTSAIVVLFE